METITDMVVLFSNKQIIVNKIVGLPGAAGGSGEPSSPGRGRVIGRNLTLIAQHHSPRRN